MNKSSIKNQNIQIEALRGIAILLVVAYHIFDRYEQIYMGTSVWWMDSWGNLGVTVFMMISAYFLINPNMLSDGYKEASKKFGRKILRLWPCYAVCITITFAITHLCELPQRTVCFKDYLLNLFFINRFFNRAYVDGAHWYLSVLLSATCIVLFFECKKIQDRPSTYICWMVIELLIDKAKFTGEIYPLGGPWVGCICMGISMRFFAEELSKQGLDSFIVVLKKHMDSGWIVVNICALFCTMLSRGIICTLELVVVIPILMFCVMEKCQFITYKWIIMVGKSSYPIYLIHQNVGFVLKRRFLSFFGNHACFVSFIVSVFVLLLGIGLYYFIERPLQIKIQKLKN